MTRSRTRRARKMKSRFLSGPYILWMVLFTLLPLGVVVYYAFTDSITGQFTLSNLSGMLDYLPIFLRSIWLSVFATLICLVIGYPVAYFIAKCKPSTQRFLQMLIMLPMCMSFLLRTLAWVSLLEDTGIINSFITALGLSPLPLIRNNGAVILGMVYNFLPFMILPIFSVIEKLDRRYIEAAQDLGAGKAQVFRRVIFPLSVPGVISGIMMVFIPSISTFAISKLLGGGMSFLLGDLIEMQFLGSAYNPHLGSAISLMMLLLVIIAMLIMNRFGDGEEGAVMM